VAAQSEVRVDSTLQREQPQLIQSGGLTAQHTGIDIGKGRPSPPGQRLPEPWRHLLGGAALNSGKPLKTVHVELARLNIKSVSDGSPPRISPRFEAESSFLRNLDT
jgi:hypothetical protein